MANAILFAMELTIDKFGRIILPKKIREHMGVGAGLKVEVKETADGVLLTPARGKSGLVMKEGILILAGSAENSAEIDWNSLVADEREERIRKIAGA
ncbi:MAG: AbrB/MazE/SpoVT family DNA-binding domain-containing protein [Acidobacteriaceae bacterium]